MISHFYPLIRSSLKKHFNTDFHLLGHNMVTKALMMLLFEMSKPFDLLLIFVMDNNCFFFVVFFLQLCIGISRVSSLAAGHSSDSSSEEEPSGFL